MNYTIYINQPACLALGLDLPDAAIVDGIKSMLASSKIETFIHKGIVYKWIAPTKLLADVPILKIKKRALMGRIKALEDKGIIDRCPANQELGKSYYKSGANWDCLFSKQPMQPNAHPMQIDAYPPMQPNAYPPMQIDAHYPNTTINPNTKDPIKAFSLFWDDYHSITGKAKTDKEACLKYWNKLKADERLKAHKSISAYSKTNDLKYLKKAYTYLRDKNFNDEFKATQPQNAIGNKVSKYYYKVNGSPHKHDNEKLFNMHKANFPNHIEIIRS